MTDLLDFLRARLDEDERVAQAADPGPWEVGPNWGARDSRVYVREQGSLLDWVGQVFAAQVSNKDRPRENAAHIALHDPARVLREVEAKRRILDRLTPFAAFDMDPIKAQAASREEWYVVTAARDVLKLMALPYADHPDYREEWRP